ncbi:MAG: OprO/OprP family phosphate-selective porin [Planctomycetaceae bacterium]
MPDIVSRRARDRRFTIHPLCVVVVFVAALGVGPRLRGDDRDGYSRPREVAPPALSGLDARTPPFSFRAPDRPAAISRRPRILESELDSLKTPAGVGRSLRPASDVAGERPPVHRETGYVSVPLGQVLGSDQPYPKVRLIGFFQADAGLIQQSGANRTAVGDAQDGADFRRTRLAAVGDAWENVGYMIEFDFAFPGRPNFMDVWLDVRQVFDSVNLRIGQYRQPIGMEGQTSAKELTFIERALPFALLPFRQIGAMAHGTARDGSMTWAASVFRFPTDVFGGNIGDNGGYGFVTRLTALLLDDGDDSLVHVGGAFSFADPSNDAVRYRSQPEFFASETGGAAFVPAGVPATVPPFVDTGVIATDHVSLFGAEFAARFRSFHMQSELLYALVDQQGGGSAAFPGIYVQAAYLLTGEIRPYNRKKGVLGRIRPREPFSRAGGRGACEIATRWSFLDLNDGGVRGGRLNNVTFGLNWYLNPYVKFQLNYLRVFLNSPVNGNSQAGITALRAQLDF